MSTGPNLVVPPPPPPASASLTFAASHLIWIALLCAVVALGGYEWVQEHDARVKAEAQTAAQQKTIDQAKTDAAAVQSNLDWQLKTLEAERDKPATPQQIIIDGSKLMPGLPQPITIQTEPATAISSQLTAKGALPEAPQQQLVIPAADFAAIQKAEIDCQENTAKATACGLTAADTATELKAVTAQRDEWKAAAKGGSWLHRTLTAAKWIAIGAGAGYGLRAASGH